MATGARDTLSVRRYGPSHGSHAHAHHQILVGLAGTLDIEVAGRGGRVAAGDALLIPAGERHDFEGARGGSECLVLDSADAGWLARPRAPAAPQEVRHLAAWIAGALGRDAVLARLHGPVLLLDAWTGPAPHAPTRPRRRVDWESLAAWVHARLDQPLSVADLAGRVHLATSQFTLRCHEAQGCGPGEWLRRERLAHAVQLRALGLPVQEVARRTGYRSPSALTAALRRRT